MHRDLPSFFPFLLTTALATAGVATAQDASRQALPGCMSTIRDASTGSCLQASSTPMLGALFPLGPHFFVDVAGQVGIGTTAPQRTLDVAGTVRARDGFEFPDGTVQRTALLPGPPGDPLGPFVPTEAVGTMTIASLSCASSGIPISSVSFLADNPATYVGAGPGGPTFQPTLQPLEVRREMDACTVELLDASLGGTMLPAVEVTVGDLVIRLTDVLVVDHELLTLADPLASERLAFQYGTVELEATGSKGAVTTSWDLQFHTGATNQAYSAESWTYGLPDADALLKEAFEVLSLSHLVQNTGMVEIGRLRLTRPLDALVPSEFDSVTTGSDSPQVTIELMQYDPMAGRDEAYLTYELDNALVGRLAIERHPSGEVVAVTDLLFERIRWETRVGGVMQAPVTWDVKNNTPRVPAPSDGTRRTSGPGR